jgi:hypothetical protein
LLSAELRPATSQDPARLSERRGCSPDAWDDEKLARAFEEHFHTYTHAARVDDYRDREGRVLFVIERREPPRIGSGPR